MASIDMGETIAVDRYSFYLYMRAAGEDDEPVLVTVGTA